MRVLFAGGGTAGHINPAISIADYTAKQEKEFAAVFVGTKDGMETKKAKSIAEETIQILDKLVGKKKENGKKYSSLFGYENNVAQYEVNLFLESNKSKDFPIYGTKHVQKDKFSYTLASVKDQESKEKAESTLSDKK